jgi:hypothetical protein
MWVNGKVVTRWSFIEGANNAKLEISNSLKNLTIQREY